METASEALRGVQRVTRPRGYGKRSKKASGTTPSPSASARRVLEITAETAAMFHYRGHECWVAGIEAAHAARWAALLEEYAMVDLPAEHRGRLVLGAGKLAEAADVLERLDDALDELDTNIASMDAEPAPAGEGSALIDTRGGAMVWSKASALIVRSAGVIGAASFAEAPMGALVRWIDGGEGVFGAFYRDDETFVG